LGKPTSLKKKYNGLEEQRGQSVSNSLTGGSVKEWIGEIFQRKRSAASEEGFRGKMES